MKNPFYLIIILLIFLSCVQPEYPVIEVIPEEIPDIIANPLNFIQLESNDIVILDNGHGRYDSWWIKEGVTFEVIIHETDNYTRFYNDSDFIISSGRAYTVGEGKDHLLDFTALHPPMMMYYFSIEVIINGVSNTVDYVIDSN